MAFNRCNRHSIISSPDTGWGKVNRITVAWKKCRVNHRLSTSHHCCAVVKRKMPYKWDRHRKTACKIVKAIILLCYPMVRLKNCSVLLLVFFFQVFHLNHTWLGELCFQNDIGCLQKSAGELKLDYQSRQHYISGY